MAKYWEIDNTALATNHIIKATQSAINEDKDLKRFEFNVKRNKDNSTGREQIEVTATVNNTSSSTIKGDILNLESELSKLGAYGVVLSRNKWTELYKIIKDNYYNFDPILTDKIDRVVTEEIAKEIFEMLCEYIEDNEIAKVEINDRTGSKIEVYHIKITDFLKEIEDSEYREYNGTDIKKALQELGYTHTNKGKFDYVASIDGKKVKMLSLKKECVSANKRVQV